jgi:hypothetical protein
MQDDTKQVSTLPPSDSTRWRELTERASKEPDPAKLLQLVHELCDEIDQTQQKKTPSQKDP